MPWWNRTQICPIGIDVTQDALLMLQLRQVRDRVEVVASARRSLEGLPSGPGGRPEAISQIVRRLIKQEGFARHAAVIALPDEILHVRTVRVPLGSIESLSNPASVPAIARAFDFDLAQASPRVLEAGEVRQGNQSFQELIVVAARNLEVDSWLTRWRSAGVQVESLEVRPCALYRALARVTPCGESFHAMLEIGSGFSRVLIGRGSTISFIKSVPVGFTQLNKAVARKLGITLSEAAQLRQRLAASAAGHPEERNDPVRLAVYDATRGSLEELALSVAACLRYHAVAFPGWPPIRLAILGPDAADSQIRSVIQAAVSIPVNAPDPLAGVDLSAMKPADRLSPRGQWAGAIGLALKRLRGEMLCFDQEQTVPPAEPGESVKSEQAAAAFVAPSANTSEPALVL